MRAFASTVVVIAMALWAGIVIGVSLIATPVKFQAQSLSMPAALDVGRTTFRALSGVELGLAAVTIAACVLARVNATAAIIVGVVIIQVLLQRYWLLPILNAQTARIIAGEPGAASSFHHALYAVMEVLKSLLLIAGAGIQLRR